MNEFFSSTDNLPQPAQKPLAVEPSQASTNEQGRPVPYFAGKVRLGATFISDAFGVRTVPVKQTVGKRSQTTGYAYYLSFAAALAHGPVDRLDALYLDDELAWEGPLSRGAADYVDLNLGSRGTARLYWGTETQTFDPTLAASGITHPPYRGLCYLIFNGLYLGTNKTNAPNIEAVMTKHPDPTWMVAPANMDDDVNPVAVFWDLWTNPRYGLGLPEARLNTTALNALATLLHEEGIGISPLLNRQTSFRQILTQLLEHFDGYLTMTSTGLIGLAAVREQEEVDATLTPEDLLEVPGVNVQPWHKTANELFVKFTNRERRFQDDAVAYRDRANYQVTGSLRSKTLQRPWVSRQTVATKIAAAAGRATALPETSVRVSVRASSATVINPGDVVALDYPDLDLAGARFRVSGKTVSSPERPSVELELRQDRSHLNAAYHLPGEDTPPVVPEYGATPPAYSGIVELPMGLTKSEDMMFGFLPVRSGQLCNTYLVYQKRYSGPFQKVSQGYRFAQRAHVAKSYPADTRLIDQTTRLELEFDTNDNTIDDLSLDDSLTDTMLVFAGDEILSIFDAELLGTGHYKVSVVRNRFGTPRLAHAVGQALYLMPREDLVFRNTSIKYHPVWRYQPGLSLNFAVFADCPDVTATYRWVGYRLHAPANLRVNGDGKAPTYQTGEGVTVDWTVTDKRRPYTDPTHVLVPSVYRTILELRGMDDTLKETFEVSGSAPPYTITNAQIIAALGSELSFRLRAYFKREYGYPSLRYDTITVTKV